MGNSDVAHRILVNDAVDTELCVKSSADKDDFNGAEIKSKTNVVSLSRKQLIYGNLYQTNTNINRQSRRKFERLPVRMRKTRDR